MIAGLSTQVASLTLYPAICLDLGWRVYRLEARSSKSSKHQVESGSGGSIQSLTYDSGRPALNPTFLPLRSSKTWKAFLALEGLATVCIYIRSIFRVAELCGGFDSHLANDEPTFMVLEGAMISIAAICLSTWGHPGIGFQGQWENLNYPMFSRKS